MQDNATKNPISIYREKVYYISGYRGIIPEQPVPVVWRRRFDILCMWIAGGVCLNLLVRSFRKEGNP